MSDAADAQGDFTIERVTEAGDARKSDDRGRARTPKSVILSSNPLTTRRRPKSQRRRRSTMTVFRIASVANITWSPTSRRKKEWP